MLPASNKGEGIQVVDAANLPSSGCTQTHVLFAIGLGWVWALGWCSPGVSNCPSAPIQTREDAVHYTGLPVLASVPVLLTTQEARAIPRRRRLLLAGAIAITIVSITVLAFALRVTHVFEMLTSGSA